MTGQELVSQVFVTLKKRNPAISIVAHPTRAILAIAAAIKPLAVILISPLMLNWDDGAVRLSQSTSWLPSVLNCWATVLAATGALRYFD